MSKELLELPMEKSFHASSSSDPHPLDEIKTLITGSLKNELVHHRKFATRAEAKAAIQEYIEIFYNCQRRHSRLGYIAPALFAQNFLETEKVG